MTTQPNDQNSQIETLRKNLSTVQATLSGIRDKVDDLRRFACEQQKIEAEILEILNAYEERHRIIHPA